MKILSKAIGAVASWVASPAGFVWCMAVLIAGGLIGLLMGFSDRWLLFYNLYLSVAATVQGNLILVAGCKSERALHQKEDELIRATPGANNEVAGIEEKEEETA